MFYVAALFPSSVMSSSHRQRLHGRRARLGPTPPAIRPFRRQASQESPHGQGSSQEQQGSPQTKGREAQAVRVGRKLAVHHAAGQKIASELLDQAPTSGDKASASALRAAAGAGRRRSSSARAASR